MRVDVYKVVFGKLICKTSAYNLHAVKTKNGVNYSCAEFISAAKLLRNSLCLGQTGFLRGNVNVIVTVRVAGGKMSLRNSQMQIVAF
jgi:hypothetical protein